MDCDIEDFILHLDDGLSLTPNQQLNEILKELEEHFDNAVFNFDEFFDELFPPLHPPLPAINDCTPIAEPSATPNINELLTTFLTPTTFYVNLLSDPVIEGKISVPPQVLLNVIRSGQIQLNHQHFSHPLENTLYGDASVKSSVPIKKYFLSKVDARISPSLATSPNNDWHSLLRDYQMVPGITVDAVVQSVRNNCSKSDLLPSEDVMFALVKHLFEDLNWFMDSLSTQLDGHKFFDASQFDEIVNRDQRETLKLSGIETASAREILENWMEIVSKYFVNINNQRRQVEEAVSKRIIATAVEKFRGRYDKDVLFQAMRHAYVNCGDHVETKVLRELNELLETETLPTGQRNTTHSISSVPSANIELIMKLLVSEYISSVNQKALRCASISNMNQFDDVNQICLSESLMSFDKKMKDVPMPIDERNKLKAQLKCELLSESDNKRAEFKKSAQKIVELSSPSSALERKHSIGIHFGFETLTVSCFDNVSKSVRTIFGPVANMVSFTPKGVSIGFIEEDGVAVTYLRDFLVELNLNRDHNTVYHGNFQVSSIIAAMLMQIDDMVKRNIKSTPKIHYAIAIPSCLNGIMQETFETAARIAHISCSLVREQCALTTTFLHTTGQAVIRNKDEYLIAMIENSDRACDSVVYKVSQKKAIDVISVTGSEQSSSVWTLGFFKALGINTELGKIKHLFNKQIRFLIYSSSSHAHNIIAEIKNQTKVSKVHVEKLNSEVVANGAALLASMNNGSQPILGFDLSRITSIDSCKHFSTKALYRLHHKNEKRNKTNVQAIYAKLRGLLDVQTQEVANCKVKTKQLLVGKMKDLEELTLPNNEKENFRLELEKDIKAIDKDMMHEFMVKEIEVKWSKENFKKET